jgi:hypothetical protein
MSIDWISKLRHLLQTLAFCLVVGTLQYAFRPERGYGPPIVYSIMIGTFAWAIIDMGRPLFPSASETGWPQGMQGLLLAGGGILGGYLLGTVSADWICTTYGLYPADRSHQGGGELRSSL